jgi:hypothetical protein
MIILIVLVCLSMAACNSSSPEAIEKQKFKAIEKEQQRDREEFAKFVERNPNVVPRYEDSNRPLTGEEQRETHDKVVSAMNREVREYSIQFPDGWKVERLKHGEVVSTVASSKELESMYTVRRLGRYSDAQDISLARAQALGDQGLEGIRQRFPNAKLHGADVIRNFNGREAMILKYQLNSAGFNKVEILVPTGEYTYQLNFIGPMSVLKATSNTMQSFKILQ